MAAGSAITMARRRHRGVAGGGLARWQPGSRAAGTRHAGHRRESA